ncbi:hypothetical protein VFPPC_17533 [Pochonia chlamydosporia 170]|uniref:Uncharacterized protein n=1 Tax=Pochonia chlamydosporia 170 TaxID=1380566 RepID=A0A219ASM9_METCM|nr:hypothetical protein VFPPC_17533 [Pochonia chlamydosporia 170]OWT43304.1 hypothetical protein VFPPC_17533 [Pochonia chlamydosporia 170]
MGDVLTWPRFYGQCLDSFIRFGRSRDMTRTITPCSAPTPRWPNRLPCWLSNLARRKQATNLAQLCSRRCPNLACCVVGVGTNSHGIVGVVNWKLCRTTKFSTFT